MGIPQHYSLELPERCLTLIEALLPAAQDLRALGQEHLGPLTTTFLLAMSTPMIVLPIERIERHRNRAEGYADDRFVNAAITAAIGEGLGGRRLSKSPFFEPGVWRLGKIQYQPAMNIARRFPEELALLLDEPEALISAAAMPASQWASCLRNALSHGGIAYLDNAGRQASGGDTEMVAFVSGRYEASRQEPELIVALRIDRESFLSFLRLWVRWLTQSGLSYAVAA